MSLCTELLLNSTIARDKNDAEKMLKNSISSGKAYEKFIKMAECLGGDTKKLENFTKEGPKAPYMEPVYAKQSGYISAIDTREIGLGIIMLGGGRTKPLQQINYTTGFSSFCQIGEKVDDKTPLCYIHAEDKDVMSLVAERIRKAIVISNEKPKESPVIIKKIA